MSFNSAKKLRICGVDDIDGDCDDTDHMTIFHTFKALIACDPE